MSDKKFAPPSNTAMSKATPASSLANASNAQSPVPSASLAPAPARDWQRIILYAAIIVLAGLFVASPAFHGTWLWDDDQEITNNAALRSAAGLNEIWKGNVGADYLPLKTTIIWVEYQLWELNNTAYHVINAIWHVINALLVWALFSRLRIKWAWIGGLLFAIHPILVESVAWVSEQKNTISLIFMLGATLCYLKYDEEDNLASLAWSLVLFLASLLCKSAVIMLPFCFLLYVWWKRGRFSLKDILATVPFFVISVVVAYVTVYFQHKNAIGSEIIPVGGYVSRTATAGMAIFFYLWKCIWPFELIPIYPRWDVANPTWAMFLPWPAMAIMLAWFWAKRATWGRHMIFGLGFFLGNLVPVLGFITMSYMRITWVADHFVYISVIGILGLVVAGAAALYEKIGAWHAPARPWALGVGVFSLVCLGAYAHRYSDVFLNESNMWEYTLSQNADAWQAHSRYGKVLLDSGKVDAAFYHIQQSNRLRPDLAETNNNMGVLLMNKRRLPESLPYFKEAVRLMPMGAFIMNYANALAGAGQFSDAIPEYEKLIKMDPNNPIVRCNYGVSLMQVGRREDAIREFRRALEIAPNMPDAQRNLDAALAQNQQAIQPVAPGQSYQPGNVFPIVPAFGGSAPVSATIPSIFLEKK